MNRIVGPWSCKGRKGCPDFDVRKFIVEAEKGVYDKGFRKYGMTRNEPWYRQLKIDTEAGLYDPDREDVAERYEEAVQVYITDHGRSMERVSSAKARLAVAKGGVASNPWINMARIISGYLGPGMDDRRVMCTVLRFKKDSGKGWRM